MVDSCRQLITVSQSNGDEDTAGMVTILTGHQVEQLCSQSTAMKVCSFLAYTLLRELVLVFFPFIFMRINETKRSVQCIEQLALGFFNVFVTSADLKQQNCLWLSVICW